MADDGLQITLADVYREVAAIRQAIAPIADLIEHVRDHEARLRTLESARWPLPSLAVLTSLAALAASWIRPGK